MLHKSFDILETKADSETGTFEATVAVFGNVDHGGDRIMPGAFSKSLERWRESGDPIPVIFNHDWADANAHIGIANATDVVETDTGLLVKAHLDVADNPVAKQVYRLLKRRSIKEFSFGYSVPKGGEKRAKDGALDLSEIDLFEVGPTLKGMNPATELHAVKSALGVEEPTDEATLRKQTEAVEREIVAEQLPETVVSEQATDLGEELLAQAVKRLEVMEAQLEGMKAAPPESVEALRRKTARLEREGQEERLPAITTSGEELYTLEEAREALVGEVKDALLEEFKANVEARAELPSEEELRKASGAVERELIAEGLPEDEAEPPTPLESIVDGLAEKLDGLVGRFDEFEKTAQEKAEVTDKEPQARSVDPLRRRSERAVLEIQSDGISERKPPKQVPEPAPPEPEKDSVLRRKFEEDMLELLTGAK